MLSALIYPVSCRNLFLEWSAVTCTRTLVLFENETIFKIRIVIKRFYDSDTGQLIFYSKRLDLLSYTYSVAAQRTAKPLYYSNQVSLLKSEFACR